MEVTAFKIISSVKVNPTNENIAMVAITLFMVIMMFAVFFTSSKTMKKYSSYIRATLFIGLVVFGAGVVFTAKQLSVKYYPETHTAMVACKYVLSDGTQEITHFTLIPREHNRFCAHPGTSVTRIKTEQFTRFFLDFETPL